jgi:hypothetical protein
MEKHESYQEGFVALLVLLLLVLVVVIFLVYVRVMKAQTIDIVNIYLL